MALPLDLLETNIFPDILLHNGIFGQYVMGGAQVQKGAMEEKKQEPSWMSKFYIKPSLSIPQKKNIATVGMYLQTKRIADNWKLAMV